MVVLVTAQRVDMLANPQHLPVCLESLRTSNTENLILCFHLIDWYTVASSNTHELIVGWVDSLHFEAAVSTLDTWVGANVENQALPRSVWQELAALQGRTPRVSLPPDNGPGREIVYPGSLRPDMVEYKSYDITDFLQAERT